MTLAAIFEPTEPRRARAGFVMFGGWAVVTGIALGLHPDPAGHGTHQQLGLSACPSVTLFDRPCPGCGLTTSWTAFVHGDLTTSFHAHPFGPFTYLAFTTLAVLSLVAALRKQRLITEGTWPNRALAAFAVVFFSFAAWRFATTPHYGTLRESAFRQGVIGAAASR